MKDTEEAPEAPGAAARLRAQAAHLSERTLWFSRGVVRVGRRQAQRRGEALLRRLAQDHPARLLRLAGPLRRMFPKRALPAQIEAVMTARIHGWRAAGPLFARLAAEGMTGGAGRVLLRPERPAPGLTLAVPGPGREGLPDAEGAVVVYTVLTGRPRLLPPLFRADGRIRFLCFTDQPVSAPGWEILPLAHPAEIAGAEPARVAAWHMLQARALLDAAAPRAEHSLFIAPDHQLLGNIDTLIGRWLGGHDFVMWRHPRCADWQDMAERHLIEGDAEAGAVLAAAEALADRRPLHGQGGLDASMIWRRHGAAEIDALMQAWWQVHLEGPAGCPADLTLYGLLHAPGSGPQAAGEALPPARPEILPSHLGTARNNIFTARAPVRRLPEARRTAIGQGLAARAGRKLPLAVVYATSHARFASTFLRGQQLSELVAARYSDLYDVTYTHETEGIRDSLVLLTKGAMATRSPEEIAEVKARNILTIGGWDDIIPRPEKARLLDGHICISHRQALDLNRLYPEVPAFHVTHHVNTQVPELIAPADRLRTAYIGDLRNTVLPASLSEMVDMVGINTRNVDDDWLQALPRYNCHWIVRQNQSWVGWKPFLKGFVAARCGSVVITTRDDGDAPFYLGDDYPFYAESFSPADLERVMVEAAAAFGGPDWVRAMDIMAEVGARCSVEQVCAEFKAMIDQLCA
ncbi:hypothetical protein [Rhodobacteraceae bacterium DSL-40]|uniref:hypothetical protein n=1 Tax=Amaricoccus sp. B4 TaxID=3368557 RepID=UPI000DAD6C4C